MRRRSETTVSTVVRDHQVIASIETDGLSIAIAVDPWIEHRTVESVLEDAGKELHHVLDVGPKQVAELDLIVDGGEWDPEPAELREGETLDVDNHARRNAEFLRHLADDVDDDELAEKARDRADELEGST